MKTSSINYKYVFNKVFTGSYLDYNLGHEIINFIETDQKERYVYLNPGGKCSDDALKKTEYVIHIMEVTYVNEDETKKEKYFELVAVSEIDTDYSKQILRYRQKKTINDKYTFEGLPIKDGKKGIFVDEKAEKYTFKAKRLLIPKKKYRILFKINSNKPSKEITNNNDINIVRINVESNPQRQIAYSKDSDINILDELICNKQSRYFDIEKKNINLNNYGDEQCFAVISDRTNLENSFSNQIAYFLSRDKNLLNKFIDLLNKKIKGKKIKTEKEFAILREHNNIDLLLVSDEDIIVIENKIDSDINGAKGKRKKYKSQLSEYYKYVMEDKNNEFKNKNGKKIPNEKKHFFILEPRYSSITKTRLNNEFTNGDCYNIVYYDELYDKLKEVIYNPYRIKKESKKERLEREFLYREFLKGLEYVKSSKAEQKRNIAYIRLNQRICELKIKNKKCKKVKL